MEGRKNGRNVRRVVTSGRRPVDDTFPVVGGHLEQVCPLIVDNNVGEDRSLHATCSRRIWIDERPQRSWHSWHAPSMTWATMGSIASPHRAAPHRTAPHLTAPCRQELRFSIGAFMYRNRRRTPMSPRTCRNVLFYYYTFLVKKKSLGVLSAFSSYRIYEIENRFKGKIWYPREIFCNIFFLIL